MLLIYANNQRLTIINRLIVIGMHVVNGFGDVGMTLDRKHGFLHFLSPLNYFFGSFGIGIQCVAFDVKPDQYSVVRSPRPPLQ